MSKQVRETDDLARSWQEYQATILDGHLGDEYHKLNPLIQRTLAALNQLRLFQRKKPSKKRKTT